jgi:hypothetical protein
MRYLKAYGKAWWNLLGWTTMGYYALVTIFYVLDLKMDSLVLPYLFYVVGLAAVGGIVKEQFLSSE